jgi:serine/threonine protein kinase
VINKLSHLGLLPSSLAKIEDVFIVGSDRVVVYEHCSGKNLLEDILMQENERYTEEKAKRIAYQVVKALEFLHSKNIFHGHLTPQALIYSNYEESMIKVTGFGYHSLLDEKIEDKYERYFHPAEKFLKRDVLCPLTDIWSVGCITYLMITGVGFPTLENG